MMFVAPPPCPGKLLGKLLLSPLRTQEAADLEVDVAVPLAAAVVASAARRYLVVEGDAVNVEDPVAKAKAGRRR